MGKGSRRVSFVGRLSLSRRVLYRRYHCISRRSTHSTEIAIPSLSRMLTVVVKVLDGLVLGGNLLSGEVVLMVIVTAIVSVGSTFGSSTMLI